ncbi:ATP-grasp domain-containing protein [Ktedonosporobacter rubrisoli]|uniref:ATP-grasp domain-containing protein n=1 Tax=Ktedonosporobacter rubrisoli TaxID=2509675 RepID=A0A4P6JIV4_KTERU|nr:biotin carboxylase N-terminal domain-containing protein [Ktedonosporobacter rubrisoli]QBD74842.1 ATP-grasp domain-containing protein [Ktedonosporobacter rubrisoli]
MAEIRTLLIADRGEIARRIIRTARKMGLRTAVIYAEPDRDAPYLREADLAIPLAGSSVSASYRDQAQILTIAKQVKAEAIHPSYGPLAENAEFARACLRAKYVWIGPPPDVLEKMGHKLAAKEFARKIGLPVVPGLAIPGADSAVWRRMADQAGYPLLLKTNAGGGGKGIRHVETPSDLIPAVLELQHSTSSATGDTTIFLERCLPAPRHIEVQILADAHNNLIHLYERDCSIQRNYQKVIEEAPALHIASELRERIRAASIALVRSLGYIGVGTVEYLVDGERFFFLEMNPRLQMEHPITECITGLDLVQLQLQVAQGQPLPLQQYELPCSGHALEARLYAEDPGAGFRRTSGRLHCFEPGLIPGIRYETGVASGQMITHYALLAKVIAHAPTRPEAIHNLAQALHEFRLSGVITNRAFLRATLTHPDFLAAKTHTEFIYQHPELLHATDIAP